ncbi:Protein ZINC INDUCED FACILITATOR-LIKE 1-like [Balamuthia mandrillaris]
MEEVFASFEAQCSSSACQWRQAKLTSEQEEEAFQAADLQLFVPRQPSSPASSAFDPSPDSLDSISRPFIVQGEMLKLSILFSFPPSYALPFEEEQKEEEEDEEEKDKEGEEKGEGATDETEKEKEPGEEQQATEQKRKKKLTKQQPQAHILSPTFFANMKTEIHFQAKIFQPSDYKRNSLSTPVLSSNNQELALSSTNNHLSSPSPPVESINEPRCKHTFLHTTHFASSCNASSSSTPAIAPSVVEAEKESRGRAGLPAPELKYLPSGRILYSIYAPVAIQEKFIDQELSVVVTLRPAPFPQRQYNHTSDAILGQLLVQPFEAYTATERLVHTRLQLKLPLKVTFQRHTLQNNCYISVTVENTWPSVRQSKSSSSSSRRAKLDDIDDDDNEIENDAAAAAEEESKVLYLHSVNLNKKDTKLLTVQSDRTGRSRSYRNAKASSDTHRRSPSPTKHVSALIAQEQEKLSSPLASSSLSSAATSTFGEVADPATVGLRFDEYFHATVQKEGDWPVALAPSDQYTFVVSIETLPACVSAFHDLSGTYGSVMAIMWSCPCIYQRKTTVSSPPNVDKEGRMGKDVGASYGGAILSEYEFQWPKSEEQPLMVTPFIQSPAPVGSVFPVELNICNLANAPTGELRLTIGTSLLTSSTTDWLFSSHSSYAPKVTATPNESPATSPRPSSPRTSPRRSNKPPTSQLQEAQRHSMHVPRARSRKQRERGGGGSTIAKRSMMTSSASSENFLNSHNKAASQNKDPLFSSGGLKAAMGLWRDPLSFASSGLLRMTMNLESSSSPSSPAKTQLSSSPPPTRRRPSMERSSRSRPGSPSRRPRRADGGHYSLDASSPEQASLSAREPRSGSVSSSPPASFASTPSPRRKLSMLKEEEAEGVSLSGLPATPPTVARHRRSRSDTTFRPEQFHSLVTNASSASSSDSSARLIPQQPDTHNSSLICLQRSLWIGRIEGNSSIKVVLEFIALREGAFELTNLRLHDVLNEQYYACHDPLVISASAN